MARRYLQFQVVGDSFRAGLPAPVGADVAKPVRKADCSHLPERASLSTGLRKLNQDLARGAALAELELTGDLLGSPRRILPASPGNTRASSTAGRAAMPHPSSRRWMPGKKRIVRWLSFLLLVLVLWQWGSAGWILAKAQLAQWLIAQAWEESRGHGQRVKPWPWADTHPIARLHMEALGVDLFVLEGAQGNSLAFGPGYMLGTALPGEGVSVIGGHRDTHFRFLKDVSLGDEIRMQTRDGRWLTYRIEQREVVDSRYTPLRLPVTDTTGLLLITCYPFDAIEPNGPLRLVVWAREIAQPLNPLQAATPDIEPEIPSPVFSL